MFYTLEPESEHNSNICVSHKTESLVFDFSLQLLMLINTDVYDFDLSPMDLLFH